MKKKFVSIILFVLTGIYTAFAQSQLDNNFVKGNVIAMLDNENDCNILCKKFEKINGVITHLKLDRILSASMRIYLFSYSAEVNDFIILNEFRKSKEVKIAQFNHYIKERVIPNDTQFGVMWDMNNTGQSGGTIDADIDAPEAWDITTGGLTAQGDTIVVAVIDGGFDLTQEDLNFWKNYHEIPNNGIDDDSNGYVDDFDGWYTQNNTDNLPIQSHGTHVSGTVGAKGNNNIGVTGVNWNVKVMPVAYGSTGGLEANVIVSYSYVRDQRKLYNQTNGAKGAFVVSTNSSFGVDNGQPNNYPMWCAMYDSLGVVGILSAGATANQNWNIDATGDIPTACTSEWLITVTNTTRTDIKNSGAGYGLTTIDLGSPGTNITSTYPSNAYQSITGTSMATPHVAGAVALMLSVSCNQFITNYKANPSSIALMIKDSLLNATDPISSLSGMTVTGGRLNLYKSVRSMQNYCSIINSIETISDHNSNYQIKTGYPNPTYNSFTLVYSSSEPTEIIFTDFIGKKVASIKEPGGYGVLHSSINITNFSNGVYFVQLRNNRGNSNVFKLIVKQ